MPVWGLPTQCTASPSTGRSRCNSSIVCTICIHSRWPSMMPLSRNSSARNRSVDRPVKSAHRHRLIPASPRMDSPLSPQAPGGAIRPLGFRAGGRGAQSRLPPATARQARLRDCAAGTVHPTGKDLVSKIAVGVDFGSSGITGAQFRIRHNPMSENRHPLQAHESLLHSNCSIRRSSRTLGVRGRLPGLNARMVPSSLSLHRSFRRQHNICQDPLVMVDT